MCAAAERRSGVDLTTLTGGRRLVAFLHPGAYATDRRPRLAGCVAEARAFRDSAFVFSALGVELVGVSAQPPAALAAFKESERRPFRLLSDQDGRFAAAAGIPIWRDEAGGVFSERVTLIVDGRGTIQEAVGCEAPSATRPALAAAHSEALLVGA